MSKNGITYEQVKLARDAIMERGERPSMLAIRTELGGTGSMTTIQKHLKEIQTQTDTEVEKQSGSVPDTLQALSMELITSAWREALSIATGEIDAIRQSSAEKVLFHEQQMSDAIAGVAVLEKELQIAEQELSQANVENNELRIKNTELKVKLEEARQRLNENSARFDQYVKQLNETLASLNKPHRKP